MFGLGLTPLFFGLCAFARSGFRVVCLLATMSGWNGSFVVAGSLREQKRCLQPGLRILTRLDFGRWLAIGCPVFVCRRRSLSMFFCRSPAASEPPVRRWRYLTPKPPSVHAGAEGGLPSFSLAAGGYYVIWRFRSGLTAPVSCFYPCVRGPSGF